ncbi:unnamed protein product [Cladocopium goreaui]|uniref:PCI domain-containing protein n=1 Tax=Cladocopium goreaui TaxID=2562237 RepID=A0A9P1DFI2_9DINO|nr:unnamed protein product [Cladocopium goreaui]
MAPSPRLPTPKVSKVLWQQKVQQQWDQHKQALPPVWSADVDHDWRLLAATFYDTIIDTFRHVEPNALDSIPKALLRRGKPFQVRVVQKDVLKRPTAGAMATFQERCLHNLLARLHEAARHELVDSPSVAQRRDKQKLWNRIQRSPHYDHALGIQRNIRRISTQLQNQIDAADAARLSRWQERMQIDKKAFRWLRQEQQPVNHAIRTDSQSPAGRTVQESLSHLQNFWSRIWNRQLINHDAFWQDYIAQTPRIPAPDAWARLTVFQVQAAHQNTLGTAAGADAWAAEELTAMCDDMWLCLIDFYHHCEDLGQIPTVWLTMRQVHIPKQKDPQVDGSTLADHLRPISIASIWWRILQSARFREPHTQQWLQRGIPSWVYGGVPGKGAEDAIAPLLVKESQKWILASLDLTKAFDFADPTLAIRVLRHLGMATRTARLLQFAWTHQVRYLQFAGETLSRPSHVRSSLPQGDLTKAFDFADPTLAIRVLRHLGMATRTARLLQFAWTHQVRYLQFAGETLSRPSHVRSSLPQGDVFSMLGMTAVLIPIANLIQAAHPCTVQSLYADDRSWASPDVPELLAVRDLWHTWTARVGLQENIPKEQIFHRNKAMRRELTSLGLPATSVNKETTILGFTMMPAQRRKATKKDVGRVQEATRRAKRCAAIPGPHHRRIRIARMTVPTKAAWGMLCRQPTKKEQNAVFLLAKQVHRWPKQASTDLLRVVLGHFWDLALQSASTAIRILSRWVGRTRTDLPPWPTKRSGWTNSVREVMKQMGYVETTEAWVWNHPHTRPLSLKLAAVRQQPNSVLQHELRQAWRYHHYHLWRSGTRRDATVCRDVHVTADRLAALKKCELTSHVIAILTGAMVSPQAYQELMQLTMTLFSSTWHKRVLQCSTLDAAGKLLPQELLAESHLLNKERYYLLVEELFHNLRSQDEDKVTLQNFERRFHDTDVRAFFHGLDLEPSDAWILFSLLDNDGSGDVDSQEFVEGLLKLKGPARAIDLAVLSRDLKTCVKQAQSSQQRLQRLEALLQAQFSQMSIRRVGKLTWVFLHAQPEAQSSSGEAEKWLMLSFHWLNPAIARTFDRRQSKGSPYRSRSARRSPFRRRRRRRSSRSRSQRSGSSDRWYRGGKGKGGKDRGKDKGKGDKKKEMEEQREKIRLWLNERLNASGAHVRPKDLTDELQNSFGVKPGRFRQLFNQTLQQYLNAYLSSGPEGAWPNDNGQFSSRTVEDNRDMRAQRAARFSSHLEKSSAPVSMVSLADAEVPNIDGGPIIGELHDMCSRDEAKEREMTRQLDKFEWKKGTDAKNPEVNLKFATKKYQRSSADKAYRSQDVRSLEACWKTMEYLMTEILDFDSNPKAGYAINSAIPYIEVYSYLRDRTRAIRVDLHLQQPRSTTQRVFVESHECCLRFEMLSLFLLLGRGQKQAEQATEKYDTKLGLKAISQTIEPLLSAYQAIHERQLAKSILAEAMGGFGLDDDDPEEYSSPFEMAARRYIVLLLMSFSPDAVSGHLAKMSRELLMHPLLTFATQVYAAFHTEDYARFLRMYREADFLTSVCMSGVADLARLRALWLLVRSYPQQVGDKISLSKIKNILAFASDDHAKAFLAFHGLQIVIDKEAGGGAMILLPKKGTPEAASLPLLQGRLPEKCEFPKGADSLLVAKFEALGLSRAEIAFGGADPVIPEEAEGEAEPEDPQGMVEEPNSLEAATEPLTVVA